MYTEVDVFVSNYTLIDPEIYQLWIEGCSSSEAVSTLHQRAVTKQTGATVELIASDVLDHYRTFALLERLLTVPAKLSEQMIFQLDEPTKQMLIEKYYELDDAVIRELVGRKLSSRHRKDLDEVSERSGAPLRCCRRQFDNVRRVFKAVEEMPGSVVANVRATFLLSERLAAKYGAVVFLACMRFDTAKRKLQYLSFSELAGCARSVQAGWTYGCSGPEYYDTEMDREFLLELRELRVLLDKEKEHKQCVLVSSRIECRPLLVAQNKIIAFRFSLVCMRLKPKLLEKSYQELELNFRVYTRALVGVACNLHRARELRSLFIDLLERCIEPLRAGGWPKSDLSQFLAAYEQCALQMDVLREADLKSVWERYMRVISQCLLTMYHS
ncbi:acidic fibroblast growth factor intracellular-binding protein isoform X1 [Pieris brassicae]|uniref:acidic fibroblast growth factor intracellular-binding protein isoform X1 n=1 Tax=Pieris brassicae TaxID=7116 RepID=UPI001E65ED86|nr:acidic fibroblast growth factor intracellular-binding protein isoform X1 [Pieris brassicae]